MIFHLAAPQHRSYPLSTDAMCAVQFYMQDSYRSPFDSSSGFAYNMYRSGLPGLVYRYVSENVGATSTVAGALGLKIGASSGRSGSMYL